MGCLLLKIFNKTRYRKIQLLKSLNCKVIIKVWEHTSLGNSIYVGKKRIYGFISNVRPRVSLYYDERCDLLNGDILIFRIPEDKRKDYNNCEYDVGCIINLEVQDNPNDMFFCDYFRIAYTNDISNIPELVKQALYKIE